MYFRRLGPALLPLLLAVSCSREEDRGAGTIAVLPFENLGGAQDLAWMSRGFSEAVRLQLAGGSRFHPLSISALRDAPSSGASRILHGYLSAVAGRLRVQADVENTATHRMVERIGVTGPLAEGMLPLARAVAHKIDAGARELPTRNAEAFRAYIAALDAQDARVAAHDFERAAALDPGFGADYVAWAQALVSRGDRAGAIQVIAAPRNQAARFPELERSRLDLIAAGLSGDRAAERQALVSLARADPGDPGVYRALGEIDTAGHAYAAAGKWYEQALQRGPDDIALLNQLGYVRAWAGDEEGAVKTLSRYRELRPEEANPLDSLGDAHYFLGRFAEAASFYEQANAKDPSFLDGGELYKAAWARLIVGDLKRADDCFAGFLKAQQNEGSSLIYRQAQWEYLTGRRAQAVSRLSQFARAAPSPAGRFAWLQLAVWSLETGDRARARQYAEKSSGSSPLAVLCRLLSGPAATAPEWNARVERLFPQPAPAGVRWLALAYALLLSKDFNAAVEPLEQLYAASVPSSPDWPAVPLAWALVETGKFQRVPELLRLNPPPDPRREDLFLSLSFPRIFYLRAALAEKQGRHEEAVRYRALFLKYQGS